MIAEAGFDDTEPAGPIDASSPLDICLRHPWDEVKQTESVAEASTTGDVTLDRKALSQFR